MFTGESGSINGKGTVHQLKSRIDFLDSPCLFGYGKV
jgi:hypothetical protein